MRKGALHRLDQPVVVLDRLAAPDAEPLVNAEDEERREPLGRRREVVQARGLELHRERLDHAGPERLEVAARDRAADRLEVGGDLAPDVAAVEILEPGAGEMRERVGERRQLADRAGRGGLALDEEGLGEAGRGAQRLGLVRLAGALPTARPGSPRGRSGRQRRGASASGSRPPSVLRVVERDLPAADRAGDRQGCIRPAPRDRVVALVAIALDRREAPGGAAGLDRAHASAGLADEPEPVAADRIHVRVDDRDRRRHRGHRLDGVAAFGQDGAAGLGRERVGRRDRGRGKDRRFWHRERRGASGGTLPSRPPMR